MLDGDPDWTRRNRPHGRRIVSNTTEGNTNCVAHQTLTSQLGKNTTLESPIAEGIAQVSHPCIDLQRPTDRMTEPEDTSTVNREQELALPPNGTHPLDYLIRTRRNFRRGL